LGAGKPPSKRPGPAQRSLRHSVRPYAPSGFAERNLKLQSTKHVMTIERLARMSRCVQTAPLIAGSALSP